MKVRGFGAWPSRNSLIGGQRRSYDEINKAKKGEERFPRAEEYASRNVEEYHHYQEQQDLTVKKDDERSKKEQQKKEQKKRRQRMIQRAVVLVAGSIVIATSYQAMAAKRAASQDGEHDNSIVENVPDNGGDDSDNSAADNTQPTQDSTADTTAAQDATADTTAADSAAAQESAAGSAAGQESAGNSAASQDFSVSWKWSEDGKSATLVITDSNGNVISEIVANITDSENAATCTKEGTRTYTASAEYEGNTYSDSRSETIPALGHTFDNGTVTTLDDGSTATDFECTRCHEHFIIKNSTTEE